MRGVGGHRVVVLVHQVAGLVDDGLVGMREHDLRTLVERLDAAGSRSLPYRSSCEAHLNSSPRDSLNTNCG